MKSKAKSLLATCLLLALLIVPCAAQIEENALVVCSDEDGEINWVIGTPEGVPVDEFKWGNSATDDTVIYDSWATAVRQKGEWLYWDIEGSDGAFWFGLAGDTPVVFDGKPAVVRERSDGNLQWFIKGSGGPIWWGKKGDTPVYLDGQYVTVREEGQWLHWYVKNPADLWDRNGDIWFGLAGDTPVVSNGQPMVVREEGDKLRWYARGGSGGVLWGNAGDVPVSVPATGAPEMPSVTDVADLADVSVAFNTQFAGIGLPSEVNVTLSNSSTVKVGINWTAAGDVYNSTLVDIQALEGELILDGITNPDELKAQVNVTVEEAEFPVLTKIVGVTEGVPEFVPSTKQKTDGLWEAARITFKALDQYGREYEINVTNDMKDTNVTARVNGIPLMWGTQVKYTIGDDLVTLNDTTLYKGDDLAIAFVKEIGKETKDLGVISYTVGEPAERVANDLILKVNSSVLAAGDTVNCTVTVVDQFKSKMAIGGEDIRWVLEKDGETVPGWPVNVAGTHEVTLTEAGTYTITAAWNSNLAIQAKTTLVVGAATLTELNVRSTSNNMTTATGTNQEDVVLNVTWNEGAVVTKDDLCFNVTKYPEGATKADIWFTVADEYDGDVIGDLFVIARTHEAGKYEFVAYVDDVEADPVTVTTTLNDTVASIELEEIGENEVTNGSTITKNLTFLSPYGEEIQVQGASVKVTNTSRVAVEKYVNEYVIGLNITGKEEGPATIIVESGSARLDVQLSVVPEGTINEAILGDLVSEHKEWAVRDNVAYMPVEFIDQYGNKMSLENSSYYPAADAHVKVYNTTGDATSNFTIKWAKANAKETGYKQYSAVVDADDDVIAAIQLNSTNGTADHVVAGPGTYTLKFVDEDDEVLAEKDFVLEPARELTSITLSRDSATIVINEKTPVITVCGYDQYSALYNISDTMRYDLNVTPYGVVTMDDQTGSDQNQTCTLTSDKAGTHPVEINVTDIKAPFELTVGDVDVVDRIEIQGQDAKVTPSGGEEYTANLIDYPARINASSGNQINLTVKAYDASGKEVGYDTSELAWAISGNASDCNVAVVNGNITIDGSSVEKDSTFTVRAAMMENPDVTDTLTITISRKEPDGQTGTYYFANKDKTPLSTIDLEVGGNISVYIYAKDQYNRPMSIPANDTSLDFGSSTALGYFTWDWENLGDVPLNLTGKTAGTATLNLLKNAVRECSATVTVTDPDSVDSIDNLSGMQAELIGAEGVTPDMTAEPTADATPTVEPTEDVTPDPTEGTVNTSGV